MLMKRTPIAAVALVSMLLVSCESKREICAQWRAKQFSTRTAVEKLGLKKGTTKYGLNAGHVADYCAFYK